VNKERKQIRLIKIKNLCDLLLTAAEKHYSTPENNELLELIARLAEECREYLKV
jgi:hypothetical protein